MVPVLSTKLIVWVKLVEWFVSLFFFSFRNISRPQKEVRSSGEGVVPLLTVFCSFLSLYCVGGWVVRGGGIVAVISQA